MDRLARNLDDLRRIVQTLTERGVRIEFVKERLSFTGRQRPSMVGVEQEVMRRWKLIIVAIPEGGFGA